MRLRAIDFCAGAGGWAVAARGLPIDVVLAIDWWGPACMTYRLNHPETLVIQADLTAPILDAVTAGDRIDLVLGGIPCEWLTVYRRISRKVAVTHSERADGRRLLDAILEMMRVIRPRWWCLEDVVGILKEIPPMTPYHVLDSREWSGQRRQRAYLGNFPVPGLSLDRRKLKDYLRPGPYRVGSRLFGRRPVRQHSFTASECLAALPDRKAPTVCGIGSRRDSEVGVVMPELPGGLRQFEWQEMATLQGYPEDYLFWGSPTDVSRMIGRSIQVDTGRAILEAICRADERIQDESAALGALVVE